MSKKGYSPEQIINKLREAEVLISQGNAVAVVTKQIGVTEQTYYRWRKEYGGMRIEQARRLKELEQENSRLKKWWPTCPWIMPFSKKPHGETFKPVQEKENGRPCVSAFGSLGKTGLQGLGPGPENPTSRYLTTSGRKAINRGRHLSGHQIWALWLPSDYSAVKQ